VGFIEPAVNAMDPRGERQADTGLDHGGRAPLGLPALFWTGSAVCCSPAVSSAGTVVFLFRVRLRCREFWGEEKRMTYLIQKFLYFFLQNLFNLKEPLPMIGIAVSRTAYSLTRPHSFVLVINLA
jgi:hypothetical protein